MRTVYNDDGQTTATVDHLVDRSGVSNRAVRGWIRFMLPA